MQSFEVEIKSLLGSAERAQEVRSAMQRIDPQSALTSKNKQLNHYFSGKALAQLQALESFLPTHSHNTFASLLKEAKSFSVRTRDKDGQTFFVIKASVDDTTSSNGITRIEFEEPTKLALAELDQRILDGGFEYQAKWSREREEYTCKGVNVTLDKNAGYGWLAEFERMVNDQKALEGARNEIRGLMRELGVEELPQDRLERMFAFYNAHWPEYYGTEKIFVVE